MKMLALLLIALPLILCANSTSNSSNKLWPKPANFTFTPEGPNITVSPCEIKYSVSSPGQIYV